MKIPRDLIEIIRKQSSGFVPAGLQPLCDELLSRYGNAVQAILFYGSCYRKADVGDGLVDLYLLVDSYRGTYHKHLLTTLNRLLPPNVFYLETSIKDTVVRAKYTIFSLADFQRGTSMNWFHSYLWGRFAQPAGILYFRNESIEKIIYTAFARAVVTFITRVLPCIPKQFDPRTLWYKGLLLSYRAELRPERPENLIRLFESISRYYGQVTRGAMAALPYSVDEVTSSNSLCYYAHISHWIRLKSRWAWRVRCIQGKLLSVLRLLKALLTFKGGIDYVLWKIERHSQITISLTPRLKRIPLLGICVLFWKLYRGGAFR